MSIAHDIKHHSTNVLFTLLTTSKGIITWKIAVNDIITWKIAVNDGVYVFVAMVGVDGSSSRFKSVVSPVRLGGLFALSLHLQN